MAGPDPSEPAAPILVYASCVQLGGKGVLLLGQSGSGKSDLALQLIDAGAILVADDQVWISRAKERLSATAPSGLAGLIEIRDLGIVRLPFATGCLLDLAVELEPGRAADRLPDPAFRSWLGAELPVLRLDPRAASCCAKIRLALNAERVA